MTTNDNEINKVDEEKGAILTAYYATLVAVGFLSCLPVHHLKLPKRIIGFDKSAQFFPLAGIIIALPSIIVLAIASYFNLPPLLCAGLCIVAMMATTGALHEDGLADVFDGFGGGRDKARKLEIMHDSRLGTYGSLALISAFALKVAALGHLLSQQDLYNTAAQWITIAAVSRAAMVYLWQAIPAANEKSLSSAYGMPRFKHAMITLGLGFGAALLLLGTSWLSPLLLITAVIYIILEAYKRICMINIGGHTGDVLGASQQIIEIALLILFCIFIS